MEAINSGSPAFDAMIEIHIEASHLSFEGEIRLLAGHVRAEDKELEGMDAFGDDILWVLV